MKKMKKINLVILGLVALSVLYFLFPREIKSDFAKEAILHSNGVSVNVTDENDMMVLKETLKGSGYTDSGLSCGFYDGLAIEMKNGLINRTFYLAADGCAVIYAVEKRKYIDIPDEDRDKLNKILEKYGLATRAV